MEDKSEFFIREATTLSGTYTLENVNALGKYAAVSGSGKYNGANVVIWNDPTNPDTQWRILESNGKYTLENVNAAGKYLAVSNSGTWNGTKILIWDNPANKDTQWNLKKIPQATT